MSRNDSWHRKISTGHYFQNGHHNTAQIQHCPISTTFHMWVDYDIPKWFLTSKNFYRSPFSKWPPQYRTNSTLSDFNDISYVGNSNNTAPSIGTIAGWGLALSLLYKRVSCSLKERANQRWLFAEYGQGGSSISSNDCKQQEMEIDKLINDV